MNVCKSSIYKNRCLVNSSARKLFHCIPLYIIVSHKIKNTTNKKKHKIKFRQNYDELFTARLTDARKLRWILHSTYFDANFDIILSNSFGSFLTNSLEFRRHFEKLKLEGVSNYIALFGGGPVAHPLDLVCRTATRRVRVPSYSLASRKIKLVEIPVCPRDKGGEEENSSYSIVWS